MILKNNLGRNGTLFKGSLFSLFSFINNGISFILVIILARFIQPAEYGNLSLFNTVVMFLGPLVGLTTSSYFSNSYFQKNSDNFHKDITAIINIHVVTGVFFAIVFVLLGDWLTSKLSLPQYTFYLAVLTVFGQNIFSMLLNWERIKERIMRYGCFSCGYAMLNFVLSLLFVVVMGQNWQGRVHAQTLCAILFLAISLYIFVRKRFFSLDLSWERYKIIILWALPLIPNMAIMWLTNGVDQYIIKYHYSLYEVGIFTFALNLNSIITMVGSAFNQTNSVELYKVLSDKMMGNATKLLVLKKKQHEFIILYVLAAIVIVVVASAIMPILMPKYKASIPYFCVLSIYGFFRCLYFLYCNYFYYYSRNKNLMYILFSSALLHLVLSLSLTQFSLYITALIYSMCELINVFFVIRGARKLRRVYLNGCVN